MLISAAALVAATYIVLPLAAVAIAGIAPEQFSTGAWADAAQRCLAVHGLTGVLLSLFVVMGGTISGIGMFNALTMSYTRIPYALAQDRLLPRAFTRTNGNPARPGLSVLVCACRVGPWLVTHVFRAPHLHRPGALRCQRWCWNSSHSSSLRLKRTRTWPVPSAIPRRHSPVRC